jgi:hypothetical protein
MDPKMQALLQRAGIAFDGFNARLLPESKTYRDIIGMDSAGGLMAMDAAYPLITNANSGIPAMLSTYIDPKLIEILVAPMKAAEAAGGEKKTGDWTTRTAMFPVIESTGEATSYGDYNESGSSGANFQFPQRQSYHYQTITQWGERELADAGLAKIDWAARLNIASALTLNKYQNKTYLFGVSGLQNYGMLNDPALPAALTPATKTAGGTAWILPNGTVNATNLEIFQDVQKMFFNLQARNQGLIDVDSALTLIMSPQSSVAMTVANGTVTTVTAWDLITKAFPNLTLRTVPEYATAAGQVVQMVVEEYEGQRTWDCTFTEKMRAHPIIQGLSSFKQKKSAGTFGTVIARPTFIEQMLGV